MVKLYVYAAVALIAVGGFFYVSHLRDTVAEQKLQIQVHELQLETYADNIKLLNEQIAREAEIEEIERDTIQELQAVPEVDRDTPLPSSVQGVLDRFHDRIQP